MSPEPVIESLEPRRLLSTIAISQSTTYQTIRGIGADFAKTARFAGAPISDPVMQYELANLHPTHARVPINLNGWEPVPDNNDPNVINWAGFKDSGRQHEQFLQLQDLQKRGMFLTASIFDAPNWIVLDPQDRQHRTVDPAKYGFLAEGIGTWLIRARDTYGLNIGEVSINESNAGYNLSFPYSVFKAFLLVAGPQFQRMGIGNVKWLIGDDGYVGAKSFVKPTLEDASIAPYIGDVGWHSWNLDNFPDNDFTDLPATASKYGKEVWSTEMGYDPLINDNDPAAFATWDNAMQYAKVYLRSLTVVQCTVLDYWEFASDFPLVSPTLNPYPAFYIVKSYMDNLPPGAKIVKAMSSTSNILAVAAKDQANNHFFAQAIDTDPTKSQSVTFTGLPNLPLTLTQSSSAENGAKIGTYTPVGGKLTLTLPANSVSTLSGQLTGGKAAAPSPSISKPTTSTTYAPGGKITFAGSATDSLDGTLAASKLSWAIEFHHGGAVDAPVTFNSVASGTFTVPATSQRQTDQFYRITLTATNSLGLRSTTSVDVKPVIANVTVASNVPGLFVRLDGLAETTNSTISEVAGLHALDAPALQFFNGHQYAFSSWSDNGARTHNVTNTGAITYIAKFTDVNGTSAAGVLLAPTADAYVADGTTAGKNSGTTADLQVKTSTDVGKSRLSYLTFNITSIGKTIGSAYLRLFGSYSGTDLIDTSVYGVSNTTWSETTITYNNRPAPDSTAQMSTQIADATQRWYQWDLTKYVTAAKAAGKTVVSFELAQPIGGSTDSFNSRQALTNMPELIVSPSTLTPPPPPVSTTTTLGAVSDAYVMDGNSANTNFGSSTQLLAKTSSKPGLTRRSYIQFDISSLKTITSAKLRLTGELSATSATNLVANLFDVSQQTWKEGSITWNNKPNFTEGPIGSVTVANTKLATYTVDLTSYLKSKKAAGASKVTILISAATSASPVIIFNSRESKTGPQLVVTS